MAASQCVDDQQANSRDLADVIAATGPASAPASAQLAG
jgi:hypothetical protein